MQSQTYNASDLTEGSEDNTLIISIDGPHFPFAKFCKAMDSFIALLTEVDKETSNSGEKTIEWSIASVRSGGINITAVAIPIDEKLDKQRPTEVLSLFQDGIEQLQAAPVIPNGFSEAALLYARAFSAILNPNDFAEIRFKSHGWSKSIVPKLKGNIDEITRTTQKFYGSVEGVLVSISVAGKQSVGIRSRTDERIVKCYFRDDLLDTAKEALGRRVYVFGLIRQHVHGPKINIQVDEMRILPSADELPSVSDILARLRS
ncbi:MAG: hypothetical protein ACPGVO_00275 [Spirulinaceae cyanobacterium]